MSSQPLELYRFLLFFTMLSTVTLLTQAVGVLVGILLDVKVSIFLFFPGLNHLWLFMQQVSVDRYL